MNYYTEEHIDLLAKHSPDVFKEWIDKDLIRTVHIGDLVRYEILDERDLEIDKIFREANEKVAEVF